MMGMRYIICQQATNRLRPLELTKHHPRCPFTAVLCSKKRTDDYLWVINEVYMQTLRSSYLHKY